MCPSSFSDGIEAIEEKLVQCEKAIGYQFQDRKLLHSALTHASSAEHRLASNERLEFLGDSILGFLVCHELFQLYPQFLEGDLTKIKSVVVSRNTCAKISRELGLEPLLIVGKGMQSIAVPDSLLSDVFESLVAAIFLDSGMEAVREFIARTIFLEIDAAVSGQLDSNYKSLLQQYAQREFGTSPNYVLVSEVGPDHHKKFEVCAQIGERRFASAWGRNKKDAEQQAAMLALKELKAAEVSQASASSESESP